MTNVGRLPLVADRWTPLVLPIRFRGIDLSGADFHAQIRLIPDTPGDPIVDLLTVDNGNAQGLRLDGVDRSGIVPVSTVILKINETTMEALPGGQEPGDDVILAWDMHITIGGLKQRRLAGPFTVRAGVTQ